MAAGARACLRGGLVRTQRGVRGLSVNSPPQPSSSGVAYPQGNMMAPRPQCPFSTTVSVHDSVRSESGGPLRASSTGVEGAVDPAACVQHDYFANDSRPIILFDGVCNMCNGGVTFCLDWDKKGVVRFAALQSEVGRTLLQHCGRAPDDISSIVYVDQATCYIKSEAVLRIGQKLEMPIPLLTSLVFPLPLFFRDNVYDFVAANRYMVFGRTESCRLSDPRFEDRFVN
eukprot:CAMPEP_0117649050 /NCGR_PEP_ID=MMETSP0804-20121206/752_1 /TAXON_ID=1074897 /ORGANISM="Tetraselmis astigmatica, Strain CCMP880" /LENGTH=227 /DNA_ID=CAMNT_0005454735 /DNA_START=36 /DNA_END=719 /DNA_ORIENTATION=+